MPLQNALDGLATEPKQDVGNASLASIDGKLPALDSGRIPVVLPPGGSGLTDSELRASPVPVAAKDGGELATDDQLRIVLQSLRMLGLTVDYVRTNGNGNTNNSLQPALQVTWPGGMVIGGVTNVSTVTTQAQMGGIPANYDQYYAAMDCERTLISKAFA